uniref:Uncharacterized protein n=3 Tax=Micrurus TaxID=8634 RepID=A0A2D4GN75_MICCO
MASCCILAWCSLARQEINSEKQSSHKKNLGRSRERKTESDSLAQPQEETLEKPMRNHLTLSVRMMISLGVISKMKVHSLWYSLVWDVCSRKGCGFIVYDLFPASFTRDTMHWMRVVSFKDASA